MTSQAQVTTTGTMSAGWRRAKQSQKAGLLLEAIFRRESETATSRPAQFSFPHPTTMMVKVASLIPGAAQPYSQPGKTDKRTRATNSHRFDTKCSSMAPTMFVAMRIKFKHNIKHRTTFKPKQILKPRNRNCQCFGVFKQTKPSHKSQK